MLTVVLFELLAKLLEITNLIIADGFPAQQFRVFKKNNVKQQHTLIRLSVTLLTLIELIVAIIVNVLAAAGTKEQSTAVIVGAAALSRKNTSR